MNVTPNVRDLIPATARDLARRLALDIRRAARSGGYLAMDSVTRRVLGRSVVQLVDDFGGRVRAYDAAAVGRRTDGWFTTTAGPNAETYGSIITMRNRSRDLVRNNPHGLKAVESLVSNAIGLGIRPRSNTGDKALDRKVDALFDAWAVDCAVDNDLDYYGLQSLMLYGFFESGESLARRRIRWPSENIAVPLQIQVLEADFLDSSRNWLLPNGAGRIIQGVQFDMLNRRGAYWLYKEHPGEFGWAFSNSFYSAPVDAENVAHLYRPTRPGQVRGVPWLHAVERALRDVDDYGDAERMRKKIEACAVAAVTGGEVDGDEMPDGADGAAPSYATDSNGVPVEMFEPGLVMNLPPGKEVKFFAPNVSPGFDSYMDVELHRIAAGARITYEQLTGDLRRVNFSSARIGDLELRRLLAPLQNQVIIPLFCRPTWKWFIQAAIAFDRLPDRPGGYPVRWIPPRMEAADRKAQAEADVIEVRGALTTLSDIHTARGGVFEDFAERRAKDDALLDEFGIISDSDPRRTMRTGGAPGNADTPKETEAEDPGNPPAKVTPAQVPADSPKAAKVAKGGKATPAKAKPTANAK